MLGFLGWPLSSHKSKNKVNKTFIHVYFLLAGTSTFIISGEAVDVSENGRFNAKFDVSVKKVFMHGTRWVF